VLARSRHPSPLTIAGVLTVLLTSALWLSPRPALPAGLAGRYFANATWSGPPIAQRLDTEISTAALAAVPELAGLQAFSAEWSGSLVIHEAALQRFATKSDDGTWLWIDDQLIIDNGGIHPPTNRVADVFLQRGVHAIRVRYAQDGGGYALQLGQVAGRGEFGPPGPLLPTAMSYAEFRARELWPLALVFLWYAVIVWSVVPALRSAFTVSSMRPFGEALRDRTFLIVALLGLAASVAHIAYGVGSFPSLSGDELPALETLQRSSTAFRDWNLRWPPLHLYTIALVLQPFEWAARLFGLPLYDAAVNALMTLTIRALSMAMLFVTLLLTFDTARQLFDRVTGYFAVALLASMPIVVYFGSLANLEIPQLCWATMAFWSWVTFARVRTLWSAVLFGALVGLSLACKDQLYAFYLAAPFAVLYIVVRDRPGGKGIAAILAALADRRVVAVGAAAIAGFAIGHQLPMEWERLVAHVEFMLGIDAMPFRAFEPTAAGQLALLLTTGKSFVWAAGVPATCAFADGMLHLAFSGRRRLLAALLLPMATYYLGFFIVILYVYDRFLIAYLPLAAMVGGAGLRALVYSTLPRMVRVGVPVAVFAAATCTVAGVNVVFQQDPRLPAREWLARHVACGSTVGVTFDMAYVPSMPCYDVWPLIPSRTENLVRLPDYVVLNEAFARRFKGTPSGSKFLVGVESGELGYHLAYRAETRPPWWAPLYWEDRFHNGEEDFETVLDKPLHAIEVWQK
jgi:4-amino-4-deoxy-L-arabinose transferase-like glycosyltransferase